MDASKILLQAHERRPDRSVRWRGALIVSIPVFCLFASIFAIAGLRSKTITALEQEKRSLQVLSETNRLLAGLAKADMGVRAYAISGRPEFLEPYAEAKTLLPQSLVSLSTQVQANRSQYQQFQKIPQLAQQQLALLEQILATTDRQGATRSVGSPTLNDRLLESKSNMDNLHSQIAAFSQGEERLKRDLALQAIWWRRLTDLVQRSCLVVGLFASGAALYLFDQLDRELAEQASRLRDSNIYLRTVFDNVVDGTIILNERGYIQSANAAAREIFGYELDELPGKHLQRLIAESFTEDSGSVMRTLVGKNQDKLRLQQETQGRRQDGNPFPMEFAISEMQLHSESLYIAIVRDITDRKQAEETLLEQAQLLDLANDTIMVRDLDDTIAYWNRGAERMYGFSAAEAVGKSVRALLKTELPQPIEQIEAIILQEGHWSGELSHTKRDGTRVIVMSSWTLHRDETGKPVAYLEINRDITALKESEAKLRKSEELYRTLVENFPNGAVFLFDKDLRYTIAEGTGLAMVGLSSQSVTGKTIWQVMPPEIVRVLEPLYLDALSGKASVAELPFANRLYDLRVVPVTNETGEVCSGMAVMQDITESKTAEEALRSRAAELTLMATVLAQTTTDLEKRNTELDQFAYIVSHDLKAPLRAIANLSLWISEDLEDRLTPDIRHHMNLMRGRVHRMEALIDGLLQYSRVGRIRTELELVDVEALLTEVIDSLAPPPEFTVRIVPGMPTLWTERIPLEQVFANLISNGIKHNHRSDGQVTISVREQTDFYEFTVADNGPGIAPEFHEKVFMMFQTLEARDKVENTGVGLAIVKKIVEDGGGTISLESEPDRGATFRFTWLKHPMERGS